MNKQSPLGTRYTPNEKVFALPICISCSILVTQFLFYKICFCASEPLPYFENHFFLCPYFYIIFQLYSTWTSKIIILDISHIQFVISHLLKHNQRYNKTLRFTFTHKCQADCHFADCFHIKPELNIAKF